MAGWPSMAAAIEVAEAGITETVTEVAVVVVEAEVEGAAAQHPEGRINNRRKRRGRVPGLSRF